MVVKTNITKVKSLSFSVRTSPLNSFAARDASRTHFIHEVVRSCVVNGFVNWTGRQGSHDYAGGI